MPTEEELAQEWLIPGETYETVAKKHGISTNRVAEAVCKIFPNMNHGLKNVMLNPNRVSDQTIADAYRKTPMSYEKLGKELGVSRYRVSCAIVALISPEERRAIQHRVQKSLVKPVRRAKFVSPLPDGNINNEQHKGRKVIVGPVPVRGGGSFVLRSPRAGEPLQKYACLVDTYGHHTQPLYPEYHKTETEDAE